MIIIYFVKNLIPFCEQIFLASTSVIAAKSKSISLGLSSTTHCFLLGGISSTTIYLFDQAQRKLTPYYKMTGEKERHSFGICKFAAGVIVVGGILDSQLTNTCEIIDLKNRRSQPIKGLYVPLIEVSLCNYQD